MNFSDINSVNDLVKANEEALSEETIVKDLMSPVYKEDPAIGIKCAIDIIENLLGFHDTCISDYIKNGEAKNAAVWAVDMNRLDNALSLIKMVQL